MATSQQAAVKFQVGDLIEWDPRLRAVMSMPGSHMSEMAKEFGPGPFKVEAVKATKDEYKDGDFEHSQILQIADASGKKLSDGLSGIFFSKVETTQVPRSEAHAA